MSEEALEEVLRKASSDAQFRSRLQTDLEGAVRGFDLSAQEKQQLRSGDRKSTRLNSSHSQISYAVFCLKKNKTQHAPANLPPSFTTPHNHQRPPPRISAPLSRNTLPASTSSPVHRSHPADDIPSRSDSV